MKKKNSWEKTQEVLERAERGDGSVVRVLKIEEISSDLAATDRDIERLDRIVKNLRSFITDCGEEDRSEFKLDVMKYETLLGRARRLRTTIALAMEVFQP